MNAGCAGKTEIPWERVPYLSALEVCSRRGAIQIHVYLYLMQVSSALQGVWRIKKGCEKRTWLHLWSCFQNTRKHNAWWRISQMSSGWEGMIQIRIPRIVNFRLDWFWDAGLVSLQNLHYRVPTTLQNSFSLTFPDKMNNFPWLISLFATLVKQY